MQHVITEQHVNIVLVNLTDVVIVHFVFYCRASSSLSLKVDIDIEESVSSFVIKFTSDD